MSGTNTNPNFENGQTVLAGVWNSTFGGKVDGTNGNAVGLLINGGTLMGTFVAGDGIVIVGEFILQNASIGTLVANGGTLTDMAINGGTVVGGTLSVQNIAATGSMQIVPGDDAGGVAVVDPLGFVNYLLDHNGNFSQAGSVVVGSGFSVGSTAIFGNDFLLNAGTIIAGAITITAAGVTGLPVLPTLDPVATGTLSVGGLQFVPGTDGGDLAIVDSLGFVSTIFEANGNLQLSGTAIIEQGLSLSGSGIFGSFGSLTASGLSGPVANAIVQLETAVAPGFTGLFIVDPLEFVGAIIDDSGSSLVNQGGVGTTIEGLTGNVSIAQVWAALIGGLGAVLPGAAGLPWNNGQFIGIS